VAAGALVGGVRGSGTEEGEEDAGAKARTRHHAIMPQRQALRGVHGPSLSIRTMLSLVAAERTATTVAAARQ
jgi:hypothetical protein